ASMKSSPIGLLVAVALGIFPAQGWAAGKSQAAGKAAAAKDTKGAAASAVVDADAPAGAGDAAPATDAATGDAAGTATTGGADDTTPGGGTGLDDICKIDPAACPNLDMDKEAARPLKEQIFAVQQAYALRVRRLELQAGWSVSMNDQFVNHPAPVLALNYYITNVLAIGVNGEYYLNSDKQFNAQVRRASRVAVPLTEYQWAAALNFTYVPAYGKFAGFGDFIFHYDAYVVGGVGALSARPIPVVDPNNRNFSFEPKLAFNAGIGLRIFFNRWFAAVLEVRDYVFNDKLENLSVDTNAQDKNRWYGETSLTNNVQAQFGFAFFIPPSFNYRLPK
ncbi:MAG: outer membrane beta-barrel domain-containing protein, partial [Pseudomonadota bacterium]